MPTLTRRRAAVAIAGGAATLAIAVPALAASTRTETLSNFKISGLSSAPAGKVTFRVRNTSGIEHEMVVIKTKTKAGSLKKTGGKASEKGSVGEVEVAGGKTKRLTLNLKKGHYALICNIGSHYGLGMHKDFTVK